MISTNQIAAVNRNHEAVAHVLLGLNDESTGSISELDETQFVSLKSGESYEVKDNLSISLQDENGKRLRSGTLMLQVVVQTWADPTFSNIEWRKKWSNRGYLWSDPLISDPMPFVIAKQPRVRECNKLARIAVKPSEPLQN